MNGDSRALKIVGCDFFKMVKAEVIGELLEF